MKRFKRKLLEYLTQNLLKAISEDEILIMTNKGWFLNKHKLSPEELVDLKQQAADLEGSILWQLMSKDIEYQAFLRGRKAKTDEDNLACHYMFYNLDLIAKYISNLKKL